ncbi:MAG TPA: protein kinase [Kofleriaceae bacterium]|nr:protein kinase [Kofleriaceae bacterium]
MGDVVPAQALANGRFRLTRLVGEGGMGVVYEAFDKDLRQAVALKMMRKPTGDSILRLKTEFRSLVDVRHENLVRLGELFVDGKTCFFTMELVEGVELLDHVWTGTKSTREKKQLTRTTLSGGMSLERMPSPGTGGETGERTLWDADTLRLEVIFDETRLRATLRQIAEALAAMHSLGKVHRDVKPTNIMVSRTGRVVLLDFGLIAEHGDGVAVGNIEGTLEYMAPEQAAGAPAQPPADMYGLGVVLYEALTGRPPFVGDALEILTCKRTLDPMPPSAMFTGIPADLDQLCLSLLARDPAKRPTAADMTGMLVDPMTTDAMPKLAPAPAVSFVGRGQELSELRRAFQDSRTHPVAILVDGESGLGKSTLMRQFAQELRSSGALLFSGRCHAHESVPFRGFDGVADAISRYLISLPVEERQALLPADVAGLSRMFRVFERLAPQVGEQQATGADVRTRRRRAFAALHELLCNLASRGPIALVIDDLQWVDADTMLLFEGILASKPPPLLLAGMIRPIRKRVNELKTGLSGLEIELRELSLPPLTVPECTELARALLRDETDERAAGIAAVCEGSPLFLEQMVAALQSGREVGGSFEQVVWERIGDLDDTTSDVLELVCAADIAIDQATIARAAGIGRQELIASVATLEKLRLVRTTGARRRDMIEPYHDRVRAATCAKLTPEQLQNRHHTLAEVLEKRQAKPWLILHHWLAANQPARAAPFAIDAAVGSQHELSARRVARLCEVALELLPPEHEARRHLCRALAVALANAGQGVAAAGWYLRSAEQSQGVEALELRRLAGDHLLRGGRVDEGLAVLRDVLAEVGVKLPTTRRDVLTSLLWRRARLALPYHRKIDNDSEGADRHRLRADVALSCGATLAIVDSILGASLHALGLLEAKRLDDPARLAMALNYEAGYAAIAGSTGAARTERALQDAAVAVKAAGTPLAEAQLQWMRGMNAFLSGRFKDAIVLLDGAARAFAERCPGRVWEQAQAELFAAWAVSHVGDLGELESRLEELVRVARWHDDRYTATQAGAGNSVLVPLAADDPTVARQRIAAAMEGWSTDGFHIQHVLALQAGCEIDLYAGDGAGAWKCICDAWPELERSLLLRIQHTKVFSLDIRARAAVASGDRAGLDDAAACVKKMQAEKLPWADALAHARLAGIAGARGQSDEAKTLLARAADELDAIDVSLHALTARLRLAALEGKTIEQTPAWQALRDRGIVRPDRWMALFQPWRELRRG